MENYNLLLSFCLAAPFVCETYFYVCRIYGYKIKKPDYGYSLHVRYSTLSRFFLIFSLPVLGYFNDTLENVDQFIRILFFYHIFLCAGLCVIYLTVSYPFKQMNNFVGFALPIIFFTIFVTSAISIINIAAKFFIDFKATILQSGTILTGFGTIIHIMIIDKVITKSTNIKKLKNNVNFVITYRFVGSLISLLLFFLIIHLFKKL